MTTIIPKKYKLNTFEEIIKYFEKENINFKDKISDLYLKDFKTYRQLQEILNVNNRTVKKILDYYNIPIRYGSDAIKSQWINNEDRRIKQSDFIKKISTGATFNRTPIEEIQTICNKYNYEYINSIKINNTFHHKIKCNNCNNYSTIKGIHSLNNKCCITHKSKRIFTSGEIKVAEYLIKKELDFATEYSFDDLYYRLKRCKLRFDFAIFHKNKLLYLIEYDGIQHFDKNKIIEKKEWKHYFNRDKLKNIYCKENNIKLIRIPYFYYEHIEEYLDYYLNI